MSKLLSFLLVIVFLTSLANSGRLRRKHFLHGHHLGHDHGYDSDIGVVVGSDCVSGCDSGVTVVKKVTVERPVVVERPVYIERPVIRKEVVVSTVPKRTVIRKSFIDVATTTSAQERCPPETDECTCVPRESCARGYIVEKVEKSASLIHRRGKRNLGLRIGGGIGGFIGGGLGGVISGHNYGSGCYENCGGGYGGYGSGFFGIALDVPKISVSVDKSYETTGCTSRRCREPEVRVVRERRCRRGRDCYQESGVTVVKEIRPVEKDIRVDVPFVNVHVKKTVDSGFVPCENCGGQKDVEPEPSVVKKRQVCPSGQVCCRQRSSAPVPAPGTCGKKNVCGVDRNTGSATKKGETDFGQYPWTVMILRFDSEGRREFLCNGVLIDTKRVLTVGQCVADFEKFADNIEVRVGEWDVSSDVELLQHESYSVSDVDISPGYDNNTLISDIAILTLTESVQNEPHVSPICLPSPREQFNAGSCVVTGWGNREPVMKETFVDCLGDEECEDKFRATKLGQNYKLHPSFLCATAKNGQSCRIDGGAPLVCQRQDGSYALIGLVSWVVDCDDVSVPEAYVRVQNYVEWINGGSNSFDSQNYARRSQG